jgi:thioredoxin reductase
VTSSNAVPATTGAQAPSDVDHDVIIVGGSFAGLAAAIQLGRARRRVLIIDAGTPRNRFATASHGFPGQDGRTPAQILETFRAEVLAYPTVRLATDEVSDARPQEADSFVVETAAGRVYRAARLILASGVVDELPHVPGLAERWGRTVLVCPYCHGYEVADRRIGVIATDEGALHRVQLLRDWSRDLTLFTNGSFELSDEQLASLDSLGVRVEAEPIQQLEGPQPDLTGVRLQDGTVVPVDALFTGSTTRMASPLAERLGCAFDDGPFGPVVRIDPRQETTVVGVFCAGDAARVPHNGILAAAGGALAGAFAHQSLVFPPQ